MTTPRFCKDCRHCGYSAPWHPMVLGASPECGATLRRDPIFGPVPVWVSCRERNANLDCPLFDPRSPPPPPWWRRLLNWLVS